MGSPWEIYENLDGFVYAADMDSYELLYLNKKAREAFGISSPEALRRRKCYELLQNCAAPCSICTNSELKPEHFIQWNYYNPILDQHLFLIDTMVEENARKCRVEVALDISIQEKQSRLADRYENLEMLVNNTLGVALQKPTPDETIQCLLECLGKILKGERAYIFEKNNKGGNDNTYEWVAAGVTPQKDNLQDVPEEVTAAWYRRFLENKHVVIHNLEDILQEDPLMYEVLKQQNIRSLVVVPLHINNKVTAFYGVDNPPNDLLEYVRGMLHIVGHFITAAMRRRDLVRQLEDLSYHDQQTGLGNRHAFHRFIDHMEQNKSLGIIFCDITGLKRTNDTLGHKAGDEIISRAAESMRQVFDSNMLFRFGGDEMVALCPGIKEEELQEKAEQIRKVSQLNGANMAFGVAWAPAGSVDIDRLMSESETQMYRDKSLYYKKMGIDRRRG